MDNTERERILDQIRKMAALANPENGGFPEEIANASAMMQRLMDKYQVSLFEVMNEDNVKDKNKFVSGSSAHIVSSLKRWHWGLGRVISRITGTRYYASSAYGVSVRSTHGRPMKNARKVHGSRMTFFGSLQTVHISVELFDHWVVLIDEMGKQAVAEYIEDLTEEMQDELKFQGVNQVRHLTGLGDQHPNVWRNSWLSGVIAGIESQLREQEASREAETKNALVLVKQEVDVAYAEFSSSFRTVSVAARNTGFNGEAFSSGKERGSTLNLNTGRKDRQIGGS